MHSETKTLPLHPSACSLTRKLAGDAAIGSVVTLCVAPFLTVVDRAIVESTAGTRSIFQSGVGSIRGMLQSPSKYFRSPTFLLMWGVYASTYGAANSLKTISEHYEHKAREQKVTYNKDAATMAVFTGTTFVNSTSCILKDQAYARMFGTNSAAASVPRMSYALWIARDFSVIGSSFLLPDLVSRHVAKIWNMNEESAKKASQVALPIMTQIIAGPLHFIGLDLYNRDLSHKGWFEASIDRSRSLCRGILPILVAKVARIVPVYSIGGVLNTSLRDSWREFVANKEDQTWLIQTPNISMWSMLVTNK